jgi:hypothetical protein
MIEIERRSKGLDKLREVRMVRIKISNRGNLPRAQSQTL